MGERTPPRLGRCASVWARGHCRGHRQHCRGAHRPDPPHQAVGQLDVRLRRGGRRRGPVRRSACSGFGVLPGNRGVDPSGQRLAIHAGRVGRRRGRSAQGGRAFELGRFGFRARWPTLRRHATPDLKRAGHTRLLLVDLGPRTKPALGGLLPCPSVQPNRQRGPGRKGRRCARLVRGRAGPCSTKSSCSRTTTAPTGGLFAAGGRDGRFAGPLWRGAGDCRAGPRPARRALLRGSGRCDPISRRG